MKSQIGKGFVRHRRFIDKSHQFKYKVFMMHLDLDELDSIFDDYWLWSVDTFNVASFKRKKYLAEKTEPLLNSVKKLIKKKTGNTIDKVLLLTNLAYFGYCFNPISVYFCLYQGKLIHCIAEVSNTPWGESHQYILTPHLIKENIYKMTFKKELHVSPFLTMDYEYHLRCKYDDHHIILHIENIRNKQCHFDATLTLNFFPINHCNLALILIKFPFMTGKVIFSIYWQALKLWIKKVKIINHENKKYEN